MNEPSTSMSVDRSAVQKSEEQKAVSLGIPYLEPYKDIDNGPLPGTLGDLDEPMKLNISYYQLERQIKLFEIINSNIQAIQDSGIYTNLRKYRMQCIYLLNLIGEDIFRGAKNKSLLTWTGKPPYLNYLKNHLLSLKSIDLVCVNL